MREVQGQRFKVQGEKGSLMDRKTEEGIRKLVKEEAREETALIHVNLRQMNAQIHILGEILKELDKTLMRGKKK